MAVKNCMPLEKVFGTVIEVDTDVEFTKEIVEVDRQENILKQYQEGIRSDKIIDLEKKTL